MLNQTVSKSPKLFTGPYYISSKFRKPGNIPIKGIPANLHNNKRHVTNNSQDLFKYKHEFDSIHKNSLHKNLILSTMVAIAKINTKKIIDYKLLYNSLKNKVPYALNDCIVLAAKEGGFAGQSSIVIIKKNYKRSVNCKIFGNGSIQLSGIDIPQTGINTVQYILILLKHLNIIENDAWINNYETTNINCKYVNAYEINQFSLFKLLKSKGCLVLFDLSHYPGINLKYFSNVYNTNKNSICQCSTPCRTKKGHGFERGSCRRITLSIFRSGTLLITGARTYDQLNEVYTYITDIFNNHKSTVKLKEFTLEPT